MKLKYKPLDISYLNLESKFETEVTKRISSIVEINKKLQNLLFVNDETPNDFYDTKLRRQIYQLMFDLKKVNKKLISERWERENEEFDNFIG